MRILHLVQRYYPAVGGAEIHMEKLSSYLAAAGHEVSVVTTDSMDFELFWDPNHRRVPEATGTYKGVTIRRFPVRHLPVSPLAYPAIRRLLWIMSRIPLVPESLMLAVSAYTPWVPEMWQWAKGPVEQYDLVGGMTTTFEPIVDAGLRIARKQGIPFACYPLTHLGAGPKPAEDSLSRFYTMRHQVGLVKASDLLVAQTAGEATYYIDQGMDAGKIAVVGPGVDPEDILGGDGQAFRQEHQINGPMVLSVGAMSLDKGTIQTVEAVRLLWRSGRDVDLVLIGAKLIQFQSYLSTLPAGDRERIHLLGPVGDDVKRDALAAATVFSMPSRADSFGISYLEAWLYGRPVIGARTWGVMDLIEEGQDGLLVPFDDPQALAWAIERLIDDPDEADRLGQNGQRKVYAQHTWDKKCAAVERLYLDLVEKHQAGPKSK